MGKNCGIMAELTAFQYHPGASLLHRLDPRFKLGALGTAGLAMFQGGPAILGAASLGCAILASGARIPLANMVRELRHFGWLILFVVLARSFSAEGEPIFRFWGIGPTDEGIRDGLVAGWRLGLAATMGLLLTATTRSWEIRAAVALLLKPFPFVPHQRIAAMMGLLLRFIPRILLAAGETADAQRARCIENRRNPVFRLATFSVPFMRNIFSEANRLATAMDARCYAEDRSTPPLCACWSDWGFLAAIIVLSILALVVSRL